jgi:hypothetical protein
MNDLDDDDLNEFDIEDDEADTANDVLCAFCELRGSTHVKLVGKIWMDVCTECGSGL